MDSSVRAFLEESDSIQVRVQVFLVIGPNGMVGYSHHDRCPNLWWILQCTRDSSR